MKNKKLINNNIDESSGAFGTVYSVDIKLPDSHKTYPFALKEAHAYLSKEQAKKDTHKSHQNYLRAKHAGLKVWNTYRISNDETSILMSIADRKKGKLIGDSNTLSQKEQEEFLPINNFKDFICEYYSQALKAKEHNISIAGDVPFFYIKTNSLDFILGDMDQLEATTQNSNKILEGNLQSMHSRLVVFFEKNLKNSSDIENYINISRGYLYKTFNLGVTRYNSS